MKWRLFYFLFSCFLMTTSQAFEVPKEFEKTSEDFWIHSRTLETVGVSREELSHAFPSSDLKKEINQLIKAKAATLEAMMNVKDWKIQRTHETKTKGQHLIWYFGSYKDSKGLPTEFAEVYQWPNSGNPISYLFTRPTSAYSEKELLERFKLGVE